MGALITISGYGNEQVNISSGLKRWLNFKIYDDIYCIIWYNPLAVFRFYSHCFIGNGVSCVCYGDSGSPVFIEKNGEYVLIGVVSYGSQIEPVIPACNGYASHFYHISHYLDWCNKTTNYAIPDCVDIPDAIRKGYHIF